MLEAAAAAGIRIVLLQTYYATGGIGQPLGPAHISPVTPSPDVGDVVSMNAAGTTDDKSLTATSYAWDFDNDGQYDDATGVTPTTTFATAGAKTIGLRVTDSDNAAAAVTHPVTVLANATPVARATFTPARPNPTATDHLQRVDLDATTIRSRRTPTPGTSTTTARTTTAPASRPPARSRPPGPRRWGFA